MTRFWHGRRRASRPLTAALTAGLFAAVVAVAGAAEDATSQAPPDTAEGEVEPEVAESVQVDPEAEDFDIADRLENILNASGMFQNPQVRVEESVVFLSGMTKSEEFRQKASELANRTEGVALVVNQIDIAKPSIWDFSSARVQIRTLLRDIVQSTPLAMVTILLLVLTWYAAKLMRVFVSHFLQRRTDNRMLQHLLERIFILVVYLVGIYVVLRVAGLGRLAATVLGGTGLFGLILGIAFRDIAENFLASLLISLQRPFRPGDVIRVNDHHGVVQSVTTRGTVLMTFEGNHVHIPNAIIYKSVLQNFSANPNTRISLIVGIDYGDQITKAQEVAIEAVRSHSAVLEEPEPTVLVDTLGTSTVNLKIQFWVNTAEHDGLKVRSAVIRKVKSAFEAAGLTMPDEAREIIFPRAVPVQMLPDEAQADRGEGARAVEEERLAAIEEGVDVSAAEGGLDSEAATIESQARQSRRPDAGIDLLEGATE